MLIVMILMALVIAVTVGVVLFARTASGSPAASTPPPPTGRWAPDPAGVHELRWWDGAAWTPSVSDAGVPGHDPL